MSDHAQNGKATNHRVEAAKKAVEAQVCKFCGRGGAGYILFSKDGPRDPAAKTAAAALGDLSDKGLADEGFAQIGFIHRIPRKDAEGNPIAVAPKADSKCCFEQLLAKRPEGSERQFAFRKSSALLAYFRVKNQEEGKDAIANDLWSGAVLGDILKPALKKAEEDKGAKAFKSTVEAPKEEPVKRKGLFG